MEVCDIGTGYVGVGRLRDPWYWQRAAIKQLIAKLKEISEMARDRSWKSDRCGKSGGADRNAEESDNGAGSDWSRYSGTETGDAQVGE